jgi:hypothetical protein
MWQTLLSAPLFQEKSLPHKDTRGVVQVKIIHPSPHVSVHRSTTSSCGIVFLKGSFSNAKIDL